MCKKLIQYIFGWKKKWINFTWNGVGLDPLAASLSFSFPLDFGSFSFSLSLFSPAGPSASFFDFFSFFGFSFFSFTGFGGFGWLGPLLQQVLSIYLFHRKSNQNIHIQSFYIWFYFYVEFFDSNSIKSIFDQTEKKNCYLKTLNCTKRSSRMNKTAFKINIDDKNREKFKK